MSIIKWLTFSAIIHVLILLPALGQELDIQLEREVKPQSPPSLEITLLKPKVTAGLVAGFVPSEGEPADTYVPDDSCAWSIDLQKQMEDNPEWYYEQDEDE